MALTVDTRNGARSSRLGDVARTRFATMTRTVRSGRTAWLVAFFAAAALIVLCRNPVAQDSDGLIGTLFSLQHMTVFFWSQDRFANLLPALAMPFHSPEINASIQLILRTALGVIAPLFACVFLTRTSRDAWLATLLSTALLLMCAPHMMQHEAFIQASPYGASFALAGLSLLMFRHARQRRSASRTIWQLCAGLLAVVAYLVNVSLVLVSGPILLGEALLFGSELAFGFGLASLAALALCRIAMAAFAGDTPTPTGFAETSAGLVALWRQMTGQPGQFVLAMLVGGAVLHLLAARDNRSGRRGARPGHAVLVVVTLVLSAVVVSFTSWYVQNLALPRYLLPAYILAAAVCGSALLAVMRRWRGPGEIVVFVVSSILLVGAVIRPAPASSSGIIVPGKQSVANAVAELVTARSLDGIEGAYWDVWPAVFAAEQMRYELDLPPGLVFGVTFRGEARRAAFIARLIEKGHLDIACIDPDPGHCNALAMVTMTPPATRMHVTAPPVRLPDGRMLTFLSLEAIDGPGAYDPAKTR